MDSPKTHTRKVFPKKGAKKEQMFFFRAYFRVLFCCLQMLVVTGAVTLIDRCENCENSGSAK